MPRKTTPTPPKYLYLSFKEHRTGGELEHPEEQFSFRSPTYIEVTFTGLGRERETSSFFPDTREIEVTDEVYNSSTVYLVIYRYQDGDSFGTSYGNWSVWAVTTDETKALKIASDIESGRLSKKGTYLPWEGYFNKLEGVEVHSFRVGKSGRVIHH